MYAVGRGQSAPRLPAISEGDGEGEGEVKFEGEGEGEGEGEVEVEVEVEDDGWVQLLSLLLNIKI